MKSVPVRGGTTPARDDRAGAANAKNALLAHLKPPAAGRRSRPAHSAGRSETAGTSARRLGARGRRAPVRLHPSDFALRRVSSRPCASLGPPTTTGASAKAEAVAIRAHKRSEQADRRQQQKRQGIADVMRRRKLSAAKSRRSPQNAGTHQQPGSLEYPDSAREADDTLQPATRAPQEGGRPPDRRPAGEGSAKGLQAGSGQPRGRGPAKPMEAQRREDTRTGQKQA